MDVFSRKAVGADVHAEEARAHAARFLDTMCRDAGIEPQPGSVQADTGGALKGATLLAPMPRRGSVPSFRRPSGRNDHPVSAALVRTLPYGPSYSPTPVARLDTARAGGVTGRHWYTHEHVHRGIRFTTPAARQAGTDTASFHNRARVSHAAQRAQPARGAGATRNWTTLERGTWKGVNEGARSVSLATRRTASYC